MATVRNSKEKTGLRRGYYAAAFADKGPFFVDGLMHGTFVRAADKLGLVDSYGSHGWNCPR